MINGVWVVRVRRWNANSRCMSVVICLSPSCPREGSSMFTRKVAATASYDEANPWSSFLAWPLFRKIPATMNTNIGTPPPKKKPKCPSLKRGMLWAWSFPAERNKKYQAPIKLARPFPAPELRAKVFFILQRMRRKTHPK